VAPIPDLPAFTPKRRRSDFLRTVPRASNPILPKNYRPSSWLTSGYGERRYVESDKPVFTVMFGGAAAFASAISEAAKHL